MLGGCPPTVAVVAHVEVIVAVGVRPAYGADQQEALVGRDEALELPPGRVDRVAEVLCRRVLPVDEPRSVDVEPALAALPVGGEIEVAVVRLRREMLGRVAVD